MNNINNYENEILDLNNELLKIKTKNIVYLNDILNIYSNNLITYSYLINKIVNSSNYESNKAYLNYFYMNPLNKENFIALAVNDHLFLKINKKSFIHFINYIYQKYFLLRKYPKFFNCNYYGLTMLPDNYYDFNNHIIKFEYIYIYITMFIKKYDYLNIDLMNKLVENKIFDFNIIKEDNNFLLYEYNLKTKYIQFDENLLEFSDIIYDTILLFNNSHYSRINININLNYLSHILSTNDSNKKILTKHNLLFLTTKNIFFNLTFYEKNIFFIPVSSKNIDYDTENLVNGSQIEKLQKLTSIIENKKKYNILYFINKQNILNEYINNVSNDIVGFFLNHDDGKFKYLPYFNNFKIENINNENILNNILYIYNISFFKYILEYGILKDFNDSFYLLNNIDYIYVFKKI